MSESRTKFADRRQVVVFARRRGTGKEDVHDVDIKKGGCARLFNPCRTCYPTVICLAGFTFASSAFGTVT